MTISSWPPAVEALWRTLSEEIRLHKKLAGILVREHRFLIAMSMEGLLSIETEKEAALESIRSNAQKLQNSIKDLAASFMIPERENITLTRLAAFLGEPDRMRIGIVQEQLVGLAGQVREQNRVNDRLLHGFLAYVSQYLNLLRMLIAGPAGYLSNGAVPEQQQSGRILALKG
jgi:flagellar biosynthesis/type III secretory pathway chaperone